MDNRIKDFWIAQPGYNWARELSVRQDGKFFVCLRCGDDGNEIDFNFMDRHCKSESHKDPEAFLKECVAKYDLQGELTKKQNGKYTFKCAKCSSELSITVRTCHSMLRGHAGSLKHSGIPKPRKKSTTKRAIMADLKKDGQKKIKTDDTLYFFFTPSVGGAAAWCYQSNKQSCNGNE